MNSKQKKGTASNRRNNQDANKQQQQQKPAEGQPRIIPQKTFETKSHEDAKRQQQTGGEQPSKKRKLGEISGGVQPIEDSKQPEKRLKIEIIEQNNPYKREYEEDKREKLRKEKLQEQVRQSLDRSQQQEGEEEASVRTEQYDERMLDQIKDILDMTSSQIEQKVAQVIQEDWMEINEKMREVWMIWATSYPVLPQDVQVFDMYTELAYINRYFIETWPKYLVAIRKILSKKFARNIVLDKSDAELMAKLPVYATNNIKDMSKFTQYLRLDTFIEASKAFKYHHIVGLANMFKDYKKVNSLKIALGSWFEDNILDTDNQVYDHYVNQETPIDTNAINEYLTLELEQLWEDQKAKGLAYFEKITKLAQQDQDLDQRMGIYEKAPSPALNMSKTRQQYRANYDKLNQPISKTKEELKQRVAELEFKEREQTQPYSVELEKLLSAKPIEQMSMEEEFHLRFTLEMAELEKRNPKGALKTRVAVKQQQLEKLAELYEDSAADREDNEEDVFKVDKEDSAEDYSEIISASSSSGEELEENEFGELEPKRQFVPRLKMRAYMDAKGRALRIRKGDERKFTKGTDPKNEELMNFLTRESVVCPMFLPMEEEDALLTNHTIEAAQHMPEIPLSELIRKEAFYRFQKSFQQAIMAEPALIKNEIQNKLLEYDSIFRIIKTQREIERDKKFTQGDFRRFCAMFYCLTRKLLKNTIFLMKREKKKRMMPRHICTAAVLTQIIPFTQTPEEVISPQQLLELDQKMDPIKYLPKEQKKRVPRAAQPKTQRPKTQAPPERKPPAQKRVAGNNVPKQVKNTQKAKKGKK